MTKHTPETMITEQILDKLGIAWAAKTVESVFLGRKGDIVDLRLTIDEVRRLQQILKSYDDLLKAAEAALAVLRFDTPDVWRDRLLAFIQAAKAQEAYEQLRSAIAKAYGEEKR